MVRTMPKTRIFKISMDKTGKKHQESLDHAVHYIEHDTDYVSEIRNNSPKGVDLILDCQYSVDSFHRDFNLLSPMGKYVLFGTQSLNFNNGFFNTARSVSTMFLFKIFSQTPVSRFSISKSWNSFIAVVGSGKYLPFETLRGQQEHLWLQPA